jgi:hypothetical protein
VRGRYPRGGRDREEGDDGEDFYPKERASYEERAHTEHRTMYPIGASRVIFAA